MTKLLGLSKYTGPLIVGSFLLFISMSFVIYGVVERLDQEQHNLVKSSVNEFQNQPLSLYLRTEKPNHYSIDSDSARAKYDQTLDISIIEPTVQKMRLPFRVETVDSSIPYDIHKCPSVIPEGYPYSWNVIDVLQHWNPDETTVPSKIHQGLCTVDWRDTNQQEIAKIYQEAELPFLIHHHPEIWQTAERWSHFDYMSGVLEKEKYRNEYSTDNHMMYWSLRGKQAPQGWEVPTENRELSFEDWHAKAMDLESKEDTASADHWYFRLDAKQVSHWMYNELPFFRPTKSFFMVDPSDARGINCRFGSKGIIAEMHYDYSRNFILLLKGQKRYVLAHPNQCKNVELYPMGHPSGRHSRVNWSDPKDWQTGNFPQAKVTEVVLQAGDGMYLPTSWFHFIVSLNMNYQCNARSGITHEHIDAIRACGFYVKS
jgi:hypothetical protein